MSILINTKICDNAKECDGADACPTDALYWDETYKKLKIDDSKCTNCGLCVKACLVGAIKLATNEEEYKKIQKEIEEDPRIVSDLFIDRYGAELKQSAFFIEKGIDLEILQADRLAVLELFNDDSIQCLAYSIPIRELFKGFTEMKYRKTSNPKIEKRYNVKQLPALLLFKNGKLLGKIEGYYDFKQKKELQEKIKEIIQ